MNRVERPIAFLAVFALVVWVGWLAYRVGTKDERHERQLADCRMRARLERSYPEGLAICLKDRYGWSDQDASLPLAEAYYEDAALRRP